MTKKDLRCCGSGVCIINELGQCWCGQMWDGEKMVATKLTTIDPLISSKEITQYPKND